MSTTSLPEWCEIPLAPVLIPVYCDRLQVQYKLEGLARMNEFFIEEIKLYKAVEGKSKHEYLVAKVRARDGSFFYLAFERSRGEILNDLEANSNDLSGGTPLPLASGTLGPVPEHVSQSHSNEPEVLPTSSSNIDAPAIQKQLFFKMFSQPLASPSSTLASLNSLLHRHEAVDKVTRLDSGTHKGKHVLLRTLTFNNTSEPAPTFPSSSSPASVTSSSSTPLRLPLYELAVLANTLHGMKKNYLLFSDNCYLYAGTIIKVLQEWYHPEIDVATSESKVVNKLRRVLGQESKRKEQRPGTWHFVEIYAGELVNTVPLKEQFDNALIAFRTPVCILNL